MRLTTAFASAAILVSAIAVGQAQQPAAPAHAGTARPQADAAAAAARSGAARQPAAAVDDRSARRT